MLRIERHQHVAMRRGQWKDAAQMWQQNGCAGGALCAPASMV
jgi:hypothetical protein